MIGKHEISEFFGHFAAFFRVFYGWSHLAHAQRGLYRLILVDHYR